MKNLFNLTGKNILITGGNGHLGKAMCEALAEYGATLIIVSKNDTKNQELYKYLSEK